MGRDRSLRSRARQRRAPGPEPLLRAELERVSLSTGGGPPPARAGWLPPRSGRDLLLRRAASLVALRDDPSAFVSSAGASPDTGAASGCRGRGRAGVRTSSVVLRPDPPAGGVSTSHSSRGPTHRLRRGPTSTAAMRRKISPATASGSSRPTSTRPTGSSTTVGTPVSSTEPTGRSRVTCRRSRSSSSSSRPRTTPLSGTSCSSPGTRSGMRRTGGSRSSSATSSPPLSPQFSPPASISRSLRLAARLLQVRLHFLWPS